MSEPFLGQIMLFGGNFAPRGWATCDGQIMSIAQNTALFSILGTTYGGNGQTTFALPDLRGRVPIQTGQGPGLSNYTLGEVTGSPSTTLTLNQMPMHSHTVNPKSGSGVPQSPLSDPTNSYPAGTDPAAGIYTATADAVMGVTPTGAAGGNQPFSVMQPLLVLTFCIATEGLYPSRS